MRIVRRRCDLSLMDHVGIHWIRDADDEKKRAPPGP
jgi:hypothetical protein